MPPVDRARWNRVSPHLDRALELIPRERERWLAALRRTDAGLAADVEALLTVHRRLDAEQFLEGETRTPPAEAVRAGMTLGAYTLVGPIGRGGMSSVWLASRSDGRFEGRAAVKLLNADSTEPHGRGAAHARRLDPGAALTSAHRTPQRRRNVTRRPALPGARIR